MDLSHLIEIPELPGPIADPKTDTFADTCKPEDNPLLNGVYIWTETTSAGHAFVSVHENTTSTCTPMDAMDAQTEAR
jgi:hypothetical protein